MVKKSSFYPPPPRKRGPVGPPARTELEVREEAPPSPAPVSKTPPSPWREGPPRVRGLWAVEDNEGVVRYGSLPKDGASYIVLGCGTDVYSHRYGFAFVRRHVAVQPVRPPDPPERGVQEVREDVLDNAAAVAKVRQRVREEASPSPAPVSKTPVFSYIRDLVDHDTAVPPLAVAELLADYDRLRERYDEALVEIVDLESERTAEQDREQQLVEDVNKYKRAAEDARQEAREERAELLRQVDHWRQRYNRLSDATAEGTG